MVDDEAAQGPAGIGSRLTWPSPAARALIGLAATVRVKPGVACEICFALGRYRSDVTFVHTAARGLLASRGALAGAQMIMVGL
jgi:hypothetical protein